MRRKQIEKAEHRAQAFNAAHPVGTLVRYYPIVGEKDFAEARTRSPAWALDCGEAVVSIEGRSGGLSLDHIWVVGRENSAVNERLG
jgi:hypothetical protein